MSRDEMDYALDQAFKAVFGELPPSGTELRRQKIEEQILARKEVSFEDMKFIFEGNNCEASHDRKVALSGSAQPTNNSG
jgi:hypothetical protein